jgi:hypothetical protein
VERFEQTDLRAFVAIQCLGLVEAMEVGALAPTDAARWLFHAGMLQQLKSAGACQGCLGLVEVGTTLMEGSQAEIAEALVALRAGALAVLAHCHEPDGASGLD